MLSDPTRTVALQQRILRDPRKKAKCCLYINIPGLVAWWLNVGRHGGSMGEAWWLNGGGMVAQWWEAWWLNLGGMVAQLGGMVAQW
jgi:hypothetical protein